MNKNIFFQAGFLFLLSCQTQPVVNDFFQDRIYKVSLEEALNKTNSVPISRIGSEIDYIPLETHPEGLLTRVNKIVVYEPYVFIINLGRVLQFKNDGSFIRQIGSRGQGPKEYLNNTIRDIAVDSLKQQLIVHEFYTHIFDLNGNHIRRFRNNSFNNTYTPERVFPFKENQFIYSILNVSQHIDPNINSLIILNDHAEVVDSFKNYHKRVQKPGFTLPFAAPFYSFQSNIRFKEFGADTLYTVEQDTLVPYAIFDLGNKALPVDLNSDELNTQGKYWLLSILEDNDHFFLRFTNWNLLDMGIYLDGVYSKATGESIILGDNGFRNDIDGGLPFFPRYLYNDSMLVDYVQAFKLREHVFNGNDLENRKLYGQKYEDLVKLANSLDDESNPVLILVKK